MVIVPKQGSSVIDKIKNSREFKATISELIKKESIEKGGSVERGDICYSSKNPLSVSGDLRLTFANAHLYNTHYDKSGDLHTILVDWYDFKDEVHLGLINGINNNAYEQQKQGLLTNFVILVPLTITKEELKLIK